MKLAGNASNNRSCLLIESGRGGLGELVVSEVMTPSGMRSSIAGRRVVIGIAAVMFIDDVVQGP